MDIRRASLGIVYKEQGKKIIACQHLPIHHRYPSRQFSMRGPARRLGDGQQSANRQSQMKREPSLGPAQVDAGDFIDAIHPIQQGVAMDDERFGRLRQVAVAIEEGLQRLDQVGVLPHIVFGEQAQCVFAEVA